MRVVDTPITELGFAGVGVGAAMVGLRPIIEFMTWNFALLAIDQIVNDAAKMRYMSRRPVQHARSSSAARTARRCSSARSTRRRSRAGYAHIPGLKVVTPGTPADAKGLLKSAIRDDNPVIFLEGEMLYNTKGEVPEGEYIVPIGKADVKREGNDVTIICHSARRCSSRWRRPKTLAEGRDRRRGRRPAHHPAARRRGDRSVRWRRRTAWSWLEEGWDFAGVGAQVVDFIQRECFDDLDAPVLRVHQADVPMPYAKNLEKAAKADATKIAAAVRRVCYKD